jgi:hypothetical protein
MTIRRLVALSLALVVATAALIQSPAGAAAHGGTRVLRTEAGPYHIEASVTQEGSLIDESIRLTSVSSGQPVLDAAVALTLENRSGARVGPMLARPVGEIYEVRYQPQDGSGWNVLVEIQGPDGSATVHHPYRRPSDSGWGGRPGLLLNLLLLGLLIAAVIVLPRLGRGRRRRAPADSTVAHE